MKWYWYSVPGSRRSKLLSTAVCQESHFEKIDNVTNRIKNYEITFQNKKLIDKRVSRKFSSTFHMKRISFVISLISNAIWIKIVERSGWSSTQLPYISNVFDQVWYHYSKLYMNNFHIPISQKSILWRTYFMFLLYINYLCKTTTYSNMFGVRQYLDWSFVCRIFEQINKLRLNWNLKTRKKSFRPIWLVNTLFKSMTFKRRNSG